MTVISTCVMRLNWPLQYARAFRARPVQGNNIAKRALVVSTPFVPHSKSPTKTDARDKTNETVSQAVPASSPAALTSAQLQLVNSIFGKEALFIKSAANFEQVPTTELPEVRIGCLNILVVEQRQVAFHLSLLNMRPFLYYRSLSWDGVMLGWIMRIVFSRYAMLHIFE